MDLRGSIDRQTDVALGPSESITTLIDSVKPHHRRAQKIASPIGLTADSMMRSLFKYAMSGQWEEVIEIYRHNPTAYKARATKSGDTALHIAVNDGQEDTVRALVEIISSQTNSGATEVLKIANKRGNTPLHLAASTGNIKMCSCIARKDPSLVGVCNHDSETPFFSAALHGKKDAFLLLHSICGVDKGRLYYRRKDGETILHVTISGEYFDLSFQIIHLYEELVYYVDHRGTSPLHLLASKPTAFRSGCPLGGYRKIIYNCTFVEELRAEEVSNAPQDQSSDQHVDSHCYPKNYETCCNFFWLLKKIVEVVTKLYKDPKHQTGDAENQQGKQSATGVGGRRLMPSNYDTFYEFVKFVSKAMLVILGSGSSEIKKLEAEKRKHIWSVQVMRKLLQQTIVYEYEHDGSSPLQSEVDETYPDMEELQEIARHTKNDQENEKSQSTGEDSKNKDGEGKEEKTSEIGKMKIQILTAEENGVTEMLEKILKLFQVGNMDLDKKNIVLMGTKKPKAPLMEMRETPIIIAAKNGIVEMMGEILEKFPEAINDVNAEKKNIVLLSVENRQPHVYQFLLLLKKNIVKESIFRQVDSKGNSALHLAATLGDFKPWRIPGAALQMQWEIKWFEFVKNSMPPNFFVRYNKEGKTPRDIFTETHKDLVKSGGEWLTNTSESCSVVAALIATVAFATSSTVPGGINETTGSPILEDQPAFKVFAISSLIALCFSVTSVVMFLAILTSRYQERDFGKDLPRKLLVGLTSLFVSIASVLVSFCAGHFFVLRDELEYAAYPVYAVTCLPVTFFAVAQFPLYFDLTWATFKKVPQRSYMVVA
uniref:PGG domain-containing protein n=1 Tax=Salix viminalis TaxID=40686 RepID=A0A6N2KM54_SALVM